MGCRPGGATTVSCCSMGVFLPSLVREGRPGGAAGAGTSEPDHGGGRSFELSARAAAFAARRAVRRAHPGDVLSGAACRVLPIVRRTAGRAPPRLAVPAGAAAARRAHLWPSIAAAPRARHRREDVPRHGETGQAGVPVRPHVPDVGSA